MTPKSKALTYITEKELSDPQYIVAVWPDGTWCEWSERHHYTEFMGDDFSKELVIEWDGAYCPIKTERMPK